MPRPLLASVLAVVCLALGGFVAAASLDRDRASGQSEPPTQTEIPTLTQPQGVPPAAPGAEQIEAQQFRWRRSLPVGKPFSGRLIRGVQLPAEGSDFFTWDPILRRAPNRPWRRWAADSTLRVLFRVVEEFRTANPDAPRVTIGDLSRPRGGDFGPRFGKPGHASHQNGLDVDVYYPRRDRLELAPRRVGQMDRLLSQDLVDRFVAAGARVVFVGPATRLTGPAKIVQTLALHDDHMHVRFFARGRVAG